MNNNRLSNLLHRAANGEELTIAFFGGSITQGSLAEKTEEMYARRVFSWWEKTFPQAAFHYVNGGIGGTTSHYGVSRVVTDLLMYQPDFVVVDFSVNDEPDTFFQETYEGLLRKILSWDSKPAVLLLNNIYYDSGKTAQDLHNEIGDYYGIPHVSIKESIYADMKAGKYTKEQLTPDGLHPNSFGHGLVAQQIINYLEKMLEKEKERILDDVEKKIKIRQEKELSKDFSRDLLSEKEFREQSVVQKKETDKKEEILLPKSLTPNTYENTKRFTIREISPKLNGFLPDTREKKGMLDHFKNGWIGKKAGDSITFTLEASNIAVQYRKTIDRPALRAKLVLDGDVENTVILDGNFEEDWGDCLWLEPILLHGEKKVHTVEITILEDEEKNSDNENKKEKNKEEKDKREKNKKERVKDNIENIKKDEKSDVEIKNEKTPFYLLSVIGDISN